MKKQAMLAVLIAIAAGNAAADSPHPSALPRCQFRGQPLPHVQDITRAIEQQPNCDDAVRLAIDCAWYSSADIQINQPAFEKCRMELQRNNIKPEEQALFDLMNKSCHERFHGSTGTIDVSADSQCLLRALNWLVHLTTQNP